MTRPPKCYICRQRWVGEPVQKVRYLCYGELGPHWTERHYHAHCLDKWNWAPEMCGRKQGPRARYIRQLVAAEEERQRKESGRPLDQDYRSTTDDLLELAFPTGTE